MQNIKIKKKERMEKKKNRSKIEKMKKIKRDFAMIVLGGEILRIL